MASRCSGIMLVLLTHMITTKSQSQSKHHATNRQPKQLQSSALRVQPMPSSNGWWSVCVDHHQQGKGAKAKGGADAPPPPRPLTIARSSCS
jgi:hypothetical protein